MRSRLLALGVLAAALAAALAGCGGGGGATKSSTGDGGTRHLSAVASAASRTQDAGSAKFALSMSMTGLPTSQKAFALTAEGAVDYAQRRGQMSFDLGSLGSLFGSSGGGGTEETTVEMIFDRTTFYMKFPLLSAMLGEGKPWLKFDLEKLSKQQGVDLGQLQQLEQGDPTQALQYLQAAGDFQKVGTEQVRGVETTHYRGTIDLQKAAGKVSSEARKQLEPLIEQAGLTQLPADAWIDEDGYLRKLTYRFAKLPGQPSASMTMTMELFDFGTKVEVTPPPSDQVTDVTELVQKGAGGGVVPQPTVPSQTGASKEGAGY